MKLPCALSEAGLNTCWAVNPMHGRASSFVSQAASARAARPSAVSALPRLLETGHRLEAVPLVSRGSHRTSRQIKSSVVFRCAVSSASHRGVAQVSGFPVKQPRWFSSALRSSAAPGAAGRAATSFARGGGSACLQAAPPNAQCVQAVCTEA